MLLTGTNDRKYPAVRRSFLGGRLAICLLLVFVSITAIAVIAVQKDPKLEPVEMLIGVLIVWLPASAIHVFALRRAMGLPLEPVPAILE